MSRVLAIDPGSQRSAWVLLEGGVPLEWNWQSNDVLIEIIREELPLTYHLVIEDVSHYGKNISVGNDVFQTVRWTGRFDEAWGGEFTYIKRPTIKTFLCGIATAKDKDVRQAVIDSFGGGELAIGGKRCQACKGKGWRGRKHDWCEGCHCVPPDNEPIVVGGMVQGSVGCGFETHPGTLHAFANDQSGGLGHRWAALAVGLTWLAR